MENPTSPAATAAAEPEEEPHVQRFGSHGFLAGPVAEASALSYPKAPASSIMESLATRTAPDSRSRRTTVESSSKACSAKNRAPHVVGAPLAASRSLTP
jgi:hypothetical protein